MVPLLAPRRGVGTYELLIEGKASHSGIAPEAELKVLFKSPHTKFRLYMRFLAMMKVFPLMSD